ncbi:MAG: xanthine dehydrogenase family protein subunit M [Candidatus Rokubacteria bacterium]|nr:xanthine dehydrogenase family protein subunit M [Candidatus Rokubacteria bacterium]
MRLRPFELVEPETLADALAALARLDGEARLIAGGTALVPMLRLGLVKPERLISLHRLPALAEIRTDDGTLRLGAIATLADIERARAVREGWPLLAEAVHRVASPAIRTSGTIGGNLCYAEAASDPAPALLCLEAEVRVAGPAGERSVPVTGFFRGFYETALEPGELVTAVRIPAVPAGALSGYVKFTPRSAEDKPLVGVAALITLDTAGRCAEARIGLAGAAPTPIRAHRAEMVLRGEAPSDTTVRAAAEAAAREAEPLSDLMGSADYRREMIRVWVRRLLVAMRDGTHRAEPNQD